METSRRQFLQKSVLAAAGLSVMGGVPEVFGAKKFTFEISLAEFSFASELYGGKMTNLDFPKRAVNEFGINVLEFVSGFFNGKHTDAAYMKELKTICDDLGVKNHLIMVDGENLAALDSAKRLHAVESHYPWVDAAKMLGCSTIRVNLGDAMGAMSGKSDEGSEAEAASAAVDGYGRLVEYAEKVKINVIVENHFGYSANPEWLMSVMNKVKSKRKGLLPDFGNFCMERTKPESNDLKALMATKCVREYDRYRGVEMMMPLAKGVSAKTHKFDADGNDPETDFKKMFSIIKASGWTGGYVGIEYEGGLMRDFGGNMEYLSNSEGVLATKKLLEKVRDELK